MAEEQESLLYPSSPTLCEETSERIGRLGETISI